jgi:hypothetical protein
MPAANIGVDAGALSARRGDGSIVENYKEFWYGMVGLAGEGANFDGNGNAIRTLLGGGLQAVNFGRSRLLNDSVVGNANLRPLGASPLYPASKPKYNLDTPCYRQALPDVNGPQAGPSAAPESEVQPPPGPIVPRSTTTTTTPAATTAANSLTEATP